MRPSTIRWCREILPHYYEVSWEVDVQTLTPNFTAEYVLELEYAVSEAKDATPQDKQCLQRAICAFLMYLKKNQPEVIDELTSEDKKN